VRERARVETCRQRATEDESARFDADHSVDVPSDEALGEPIEDDVKRARIGQERRDVFEGESPASENPARRGSWTTRT